MPVGLFFVWSLFLAWHKRERWGLCNTAWPRYVVTVWYIHWQCNLMWRSVHHALFNFIFLFFLIILMKASSSLSCHWKQELGIKVLIWGWALYQKHGAFQASTCFLSKCQTCSLVSTLFMDCLFVLSGYRVVCIDFSLYFICFLVFFQDTFSQWDVRALEAGLTEGAW